MTETHSKMEDLKKDVEKLTKQVGIWKDSAMKKGKEIKELKEKLAQAEKGGGGGQPQDPSCENAELAKVQDDRDRAVQEKLILKDRMQKEMDEIKDSLKQLQD